MCDPGYAFCAWRGTTILRPLNTPCRNAHCLARLRRESKQMGESAWSTAETSALAKANGR
jgi:hypothetical protein